MRTTLNSPMVQLLALCSLLIHAADARADRAAWAPVHADHAMVVSASHLATEAGLEIMRNGGNAFDAAACTGFVLAVTYPYAGNIGGGGFLVARTADGESFTLDFRETAPAAAHRDMYLDEAGEIRDGVLPRSPLAVGVPGSVDGMLRIWRDHGSGRIGRRALLAPAIRLARNGFPVSHEFAGLLNARRDRLARDPAARAIFVRADGEPWRDGDRLVQRDLARTLRRIARNGRDGFYTGPVAARFAEQMRATGGIITETDLRSYQSIYREPVTGTFHDFEIISMGPPSSGGIFLVQMLNMLETHDLRALGRGSSRYVHLLTETQRRAYADRAEHLGDPDFWNVPAAGLTSKAYAQERMANFTFERATPSEDIGHGTPATYESTETTHYSIVDSEGNAVAVTTTINHPFGSAIVLAGAGFLLNNEMDDFSAKPGVPNLFGLIGNEANAVEPGKRMLSSMSPTIVVENGETRFVIGTPGGATIITTVLQIFLNASVHDMDILQAVAAPRHHAQWLPDKIFIEPHAFPADVQQRLEALGHRIERYPRGDIGQANCIAITPDGLFGAADPRRDNAAAGF